jgi:hypothetical protein
LHKNWNRSFARGPHATPVIRVQRPGRRSTAPAPLVWRLRSTRARAGACAGGHRPVGMGKDDSEASSSQGKPPAPRLTDHREASRREKGCFAQLIIGHNDAVQCVRPSVRPSVETIESFQSVALPLLRRFSFHEMEMLELAACSIDPLLACRTCTCEAEHSWPTCLVLQGRLNFCWLSAQVPLEPLLPASFWNNISRAHAIRPRTVRAVAAGARAAIHAAVTRGTTE